ncbi:TetR/AcrR family transcriptional regulator [Sporolactobacillus terrae]|uniref:TetR/AcrR family transcriptional regulator n=1 Tax=Sporolactobacillus terrae TaxID=269673 RepID=A0ABX5Q9U6_9BACL|nr:TetR/AcrR family transcriptional regulator [Sporolactobacillus terrae]QAA23410.1 TetR/AcrR family transcriptional regulator [Sporolactobacillus terrae]QAA26380.1 TetR/AcrR family transcriptional regulator [Sporolactobacillus terrae]UAK15474.1 TetR/AcrR family transcriptional regulator [Sporolactobacillus terrae]
MRKPVSVDQYIEKIKPVIRRNKFSQLKIDDIAKYMDISKVTLYKHFSSKDEIIQRVVMYYINYLQGADTFVKDDSVSYVERFQMTFLQSLICVAFISDLFLNDLKEFYPHHFEDLAAAQQSRIKNLQTFFESGMKQKIFNKLNAVLFMVQDDAVLRHFMEPSFSIQYDVTLKQAIMDFYKMKEYQLLKPEHLDTVDDSVIEKEVSKVLQTIS